MDILQKVPRPEGWYLAWMSLTLVFMPGLDQLYAMDPAIPESHSAPSIQSHTHDKKRGIRYSRFISRQDRKRRTDEMLLAAEQETRSVRTYRRPGACAPRSTSSPTAARPSPPPFREKRKLLSDRAPALPICACDSATGVGEEGEGKRVWGSSCAALLGGARNESVAGTAVRRWRRLRRAAGSWFWAVSGCAVVNRSARLDAVRGDGLCSLPWSQS
jgi:hypothetical protein